MKEIERIEKLIGSAKLKNAIEALLKMNTEHRGEILGLKTQLSALEKKERQGIIGNSEANLERNQITVSLLNVLSILKKDDSPTSESMTNETSLEKKNQDGSNKTNQQWA